MPDLVLANLTLLTSGPLLVAVGVVEHRRWRRVQAERQHLQAVVDAVDRLMAGLRSGASLPQAYRAVIGFTGPSRLTTDRLVTVTVEQLLAKGGPAIPTLQRLRHTLIGRVNGRRLAEVESAQALASARLLLVAPLIFAVGVSAVDPAVAHFYRADPVGSLCVFFAIALAWVGWLWMSSAAASAVRAL